MLIKKIQLTNFDDQVRTITLLLLNILSLVVLQVEQDPNASDAYLVFVKAYNNISTIETGEKIGPSTPKYQIYRYNSSL